MPAPLALGLCIAVELLVAWRIAASVRETALSVLATLVVITLWGW